MGSRSVPQQSDPGQSHRPDGGAGSSSTSCGRTRRAPAGTDPWRNNFFFAPNLAFDTFHNYATKVDQNISDKTRMFVRYAYNKRTEERYTNGITTGPAQDGQLPLERTNHDGRLRLGSHRQFVLGVQRPRRTEPVPRVGAFGSGLSFNPSELGFPSSLVNQLPNKVFPRLNFFTSGTTVEYQPLGRNNRNSETTTGFSLQPNFSWTKGKHNVRGGLDMRMTWYTREINPTCSSSASTGASRSESFNAADALSGNAIASFLLGAPASGAIANNFYPTLRWNYNAPWVQDDWRLTDKLTLNLGFRWDFNTPVFEEDNRLNYVFDTTSTNPVNGRINTALLPNGGPLRGGPTFVEVNGNPKYPYQYDKNNIQPRVGFAYQLNDKMVVRGGYGLYYINVVGHRFVGWLRDRDAAHYLSRRRSHLDVPASPIRSRRASRRRPERRADWKRFSAAISSFARTDFVNPYVHQFSLGISATAAVADDRRACLRRQPHAGTSRTGGRASTRHPSALRDRCDPTKGGSVAFCNELLPNPFFQVPGFEGTTRFTSPTLSRHELSRPFPQFTQITELDRNDGQIWYNSAQLMVNKRMSSGVTVAGTYTWSKMIEENGGGNQVGGTAIAQAVFTEPDVVLQRSPYGSDRRHRITLSGVYQLPFGSDRRFMNNANPVVDAIAGGWEVAGMWLFNSGRPWDLPANVFYVKDATIRNINYDDPDVIRGVQNCVAQMNDFGVVTMLGFSTAAGCTEPNFIIRPELYAADDGLPRRSDSPSAVLPVRRELRQDDAHCR